MFEVVEQSPDLSAFKLPSYITGRVAQELEEKVCSEQSCSDGLSISRWTSIAKDSSLVRGSAEFAQSRRFFVHSSAEDAVPPCTHASHPHCDVPLAGMQFSVLSDGMHPAESVLDVSIAILRLPTLVGKLAVPRHVSSPCFCASGMSVALSSVGSIHSLWLWAVILLLLFLCRWLLRTCMGCLAPAAWGADP